MRKIAWLTTLLLFVNMNTSWAASKPLPGKVCPKVGSVQISSGFKFTCIKSGKKLVWNSGVKIPIPSKTNSTPSAVPSIQPSSHKDFDELCTNQFEKNIIDGKPAMCTPINGKLTWQKDTFEMLTKTWTVVQKIKNKNQVPTVALEIKYSPTLDKAYADFLLNGLLDGARFWQNEFLPKTPMPVLLYSEKDRGWYEDQFRIIGISQEVIQSKMKAFDDEVKRNGSRMNMAGMNGASGKIWFEFSIGSDFGTKITWDDKRASELNSLKAGAHEYMHSAQFEVIDSQNLDFVPCWFLEGGAEFYGMTIGATDLKVLQEMRYNQVWEKYFYNFPGMAYEPTYGWEKFIENNREFTNGDVLEKECGPNGAYPVGSVATQYLFELGGQASIVQFMEKIRSTQNWKSSLFSVYGIPWEQMKKEMADYIRLIVAQTPR